MIAITQEGKNTYLVQVKEPENSWLIDLSKSLGMKRSVMLAACFSNGIQHYYGVIREIDEHDKEEPKPDATEHKEFNKGSCQG